MSYSLLIKCILVGDTKVGKSCLLIQFTANKFQLKHEVTIGVEFGTRLIKIDNIFVNFQIWDTAGEKRYRSITRSYYKGAAVAFILFDVTNRDSFESLNMWINDIKNNGPSGIIVLVVANKVDREEDRCVSTEEGIKFANQHSVVYVETDAKDKNSVERIFQLVARFVYSKVKDGTIDTYSYSSGVRARNH